MAIATKFPLTYLELAEFGQGKEIVRFPATMAEYWELLAHAEYRADFYQNEIIAMSYEPDLNSRITNWISHLLLLAFKGRKDLWHFNSSLL